MALTRREVCVLLPALAVTATTPHAQGEEKTLKQLPSAVYNFDDLKAVHKDKHDYFHVFDGKTHGGTHIRLHESALGPGAVVHGLSSHAGDEMFMVREGILEVEFDGKRNEVGPGSLAYIASHTPYAIRNTGKEWAKYFVLLFEEPA